MATEAHVRPLGSLSRAERERLALRGTQGRVYFDASDETPNVRLWDIVAASWTQPVSRTLAYSLYTRMVASKCSACSELALRAEEIAQHIRQVGERAARHKGAAVGTVEKGHARLPCCTACGTTFQRGPMYAERHIAAALAGPAMHKGAVCETTLRFSIAPLVFKPGPVETPQVPGLSPEGAQEERSRPQRRRRRRGRGKRKAA